VNHFEQVLHENAFIASPARGDGVVACRCVICLPPRFIDPLESHRQQHCPDGAKSSIDFFSERVRSAPGAVTVKDASGVRVDLDDAKSDNNGRVVRTSVRPLETGTYRVDWRVQSSDSHAAQGSFTFQVSP
jgi:hypothetical protein